MPTVEERLGQLELALLALGTLEFGDKPGHEFHGNQHTGGHGGKDEKDDHKKHKKDDGLGDISTLFTPWRDGKGYELDKTAKLFSTIFDPTKEQIKAMKQAFARVEALELAVLTLAAAEFGNVDDEPRDGHGRWTNGGGPSDWGPYGKGVGLKSSSDVRGDLYKVMKDGKNMGSVQQIHEFIENIPGNGRGFEGHPIVGVTKEFDTRDEAVRHVLEETKPIHSPTAEEQDNQDWKEWEERKNKGWMTGVGVAASG